MKLQPEEVCKYSDKCPYADSGYGNTCAGTNNKRHTVFICNYVHLVNDELYFNGRIRNKQDVTGQMIIIHS